MTHNQPITSRTIHIAQTNQLSIRLKQMAMLWFEIDIWLDWFGMGQDSIRLNYFQIDTILVGVVLFDCVTS